MPLSPTCRKLSSCNGCLQFVGRQAQVAAARSSANDGAWKSTKHRPCRPQVAPPPGVRAGHKRKLQLAEVAEPHSDGHLSQVASPKASDQAAVPPLQGYPQAATCRSSCREGTSLQRHVPLGDSTQTIRPVPLLTRYRSGGSRDFQPLMLDLLRAQIAEVQPSTAAISAARSSPGRPADSQPADDASGSLRDAPPGSHPEDSAASTPACSPTAFSSSDLVAMAAQPCRMVASPPRRPALRQPSPRQVAPPRQRPTLESVWRELHGGGPEVLPRSLSESRAARMERAARHAAALTRCSSSREISAGWQEGPDGSGRSPNPPPGKAPAAATWRVRRAWYLALAGGAAGKGPAAALATTGATGRDSG